MVALRYHFPPVYLALHQASAFLLARQGLLALHPIRLASRPALHHPVSDPELLPRELRHQEPLSLVYRKDPESQTLCPLRIYPTSTLMPRLYAWAQLPQNHKHSPKGVAPHLGPLDPRQQVVVPVDIMHRVAAARNRLSKISLQHFSYHQLRNS